MMDLSRTTNLTPQEDAAICLQMQSVALDAIFRSHALRPNEIVFHGGNSIRLCWESQRFSSDLDFMITTEAAERLKGALRSVSGRIEASMQPETPGCSIILKEGKERDGNNILRWDIKWNHQARHGRPHVKLEFMCVHRDRLATYPATLRTMSPGIGIRLPASPLVNVGTLEALAADKLVALACRDFFKARDLYDLWHLFAPPKKLDPEEVAELAAVVGRIYGREQSEIAAGLDKALENSAVWDAASFSADIVRWLPDDLHRLYSRSRHMEHMLREVRSAVEIAADVLREPTQSFRPAAA